MDNKTKLEELEEIFLRGSELIASSRLVVADNPSISSLQHAEDALLKYLM